MIEQQLVNIVSIANTIVNFKSLNFDILKNDFLARIICQKIKKGN